MTVEKLPGLAPGLVSVGERITRWLAENPVSEEERKAAAERIWRSRQQENSTAKQQSRDWEEAPIIIAAERIKRS